MKFVFNFTGYPYNFTLERGAYKIKAWGAQGGTCSYENSGFGGYSEAFLHIFNSKQISIIVGGKGQSSNDRSVPGGYNGGGSSGLGTENNCGSSGGGATTVLMKLNNEYTPILIAGGGGGTSIYCGVVSYGGQGGNSFGGNSTGPYDEHKGLGGQQTLTENGGFWKNTEISTSGGKGTYLQGGYGSFVAKAHASGGGGGYFGGGGGADTGAGGGGSGFVSSLLRGKTKFCTNNCISGDGLIIIESANVVSCKQIRRSKACILLLSLVYNS